MTAADSDMRDDFDVRFEWGAAGTVALALQARVMVVVDVLRFTTAVEAAVSRGAIVYPYRWRDGSAAAFASSVGAVRADESDPAGPSLSPLSLCRLGAGDAVVLPSPNGSTCAALADEADTAVVASCLRNASAVAAWLNNSARPVVVIACGERRPDGSLRQCLEDLLGAAPSSAVFRARALQRRPRPLVTGRPLVTTMSQQSCGSAAPVESCKPRVTGTMSHTRTRSVPARSCPC